MANGRCSNRWQPASFFKKKEKAPAQKTSHKAVINYVGP